MKFHFLLITFCKSEANLISSKVSLLGSYVVTFPFVSYLFKDLALNYSGILRLHE